MVWQQATTGKPPRLAENELHLWHLPLELNAADTVQAIKMLNATQRDKYHRRATEELQKAYLAGRFHLLTLLAAYNSVEPLDLQLSYGRLNKPYLDPNPQNIEFNFTDTTTDQGASALLAFTKTHAVGVDIEALTRRSNFAAIVARRFSAAETAYVTAGDGEIDAQRFLAYWTRKEAFGKATGRGINFKMQDMDLASPGSFELNFTSDHQPGLPFRLQQIQLGTDFIASVVHASHQPLTIKSFKSANHWP